MIEAMTTVRGGQPRIVQYNGSFYVIGTAYGYLYDMTGTPRTWKSVCGARKALKKYLSVWS